MNRLVPTVLLVLTLEVFAAGKPSQTPATTETAILAGGCFWCIESDYEKKVQGVTDVVSGYIGGHVSNPTYEQVSSGGSGHIEAVKISFDPATISYAEILDFYWRHIDPTRDDGQFCDRGAQYRPAIFYLDEQQKRIAQQSRLAIEQAKPFSQPIRVELIEATEFYPAEAYHQDYYRKNPVRYNYYRYACGRDARVEELWGASGE